LNPEQTTETIWAFGHPNILAIHPTTLMFTKDTCVSERGDCIVAVATNRSLVDLSNQFKDALKKTNAIVTIIIEAGDVKERINATGSPNLILNHATDMVIRKSNYVCNRTLAVSAEKASNDLSRILVEKLKDPKQKIKVTLTVTT
jgi:uncharacterized protein